MATAAVILAVMSACQPPPRLVPTPRPVTWPGTITWKRLPKLPPSAGLGLTSRPPQGRNGDRVLERTYPLKGPTGHGLFGTVVRFHVDDGAFYLRSNCGVAHLDTWMGPFDGDPREVLKPSGD